MKASVIVKKLKSMRNSENVEGMERFGIVGKEVLGISIYVLRGLAKVYGKSHETARELWNTGIREAKLLAVFMEEVEKVSEEQMDEWSHDFESWDDCDQACTSLFDKTPYAWKKVRDWSDREDELGKRAAFSLLAGLAVHDKKAKDEKFIQTFRIIKKASTDDRNYVKKAVNWALRSIGKRDKRLNKEAIKFSEQLLESDSKTAQWIAKKALKELKSEKVKKRLSKN